MVLSSHKVPQCTILDCGPRMKPAEEVGDGSEQQAEVALPTLPREILRQIVSLAMVARGGGKLQMTYLTNAIFRPEINIACLLLDRDLYHTARRSLYQNNDFLFMNDGYEVRTIANCVGLLSCRESGCIAGSGPVLAKATFELGCKIDSYRSEMRLVSFCKALRSLRRPLQVETLTVQLQNYAWRFEGQLRVFLQALRNVKVLKYLVLRGLDVHLETNLRAIPWIMGMDLQPVESIVTFRGKEAEHLGHFECRYQKLDQVDRSEQLVDLPCWCPHDFDDPTSAYFKWITSAEGACILNGLDYAHGFEAS